MKIHDAETEKPPINEWVFAINNFGYVGVAYWNGTEWRTIDYAPVKPRKITLIEHILGRQTANLYITHWISNGMD